MFKILNNIWNWTSTGLSIILFSVILLGVALFLAATCSFGMVLQIIVVAGSLLTNALLASKHYRRWGYLVGFVNIFFWVALEINYIQWFMALANIIFLIIWIRGLQNNWNRE